MIATDDGVDGITGGAGGDEDGGGNIGSKIFWINVVHICVLLLFVKTRICGSLWCSDKVF